MPNCRCEAFAVGIGSPGRVEDSEYLYRLVITPGDFDQNTGKLLLEALSDAKKDGLSVFRESATDEDIVALIGERLARRPGKQTKTVQALLRFKVQPVRDLADAHAGRLFCVYDETVPRFDPSLPRVATHVTILQRLRSAGSADRQTAIKKDTRALYNLIERSFVDLASFRSGLILGLNQRSLDGDFDLQTTH